MEDMNANLSRRFSVGNKLNFRYATHVISVTAVVKCGKEVHMRVTFLTVLIALLLTTSIDAQETADVSNPSSVTVLEKHWEKRVPPSRDSLRRNEEVMDQTRKEKDVIKRRDQSLPDQPTEEKMPVPQPRPLVQSKQLEAYALYIYRIKVRNNSSKTITRLYWEYQFIDPDTQELMGTRKIFSDLKLRPGEIHEITAYSRTQPARIVNVNKLDRKYKDQFTERLVIHRIHYSDGTAWQRPAQ